MKQILLAGELNEFMIDDNLTVYADSLEQDMIVFDVDNNPLADTEFTFENKVYKTGADGQITSIEDVPTQDAQPADVQAADVTSTDTQTADTTSNDTPNVELEAAQKRIDDLEVENQALKAELETLKQEAVQLAAQPASEGINLSDVPTLEVDNKPKSTLDVIRAALNK